MLSELRRYTWHVLWRPCEDVPILTEEFDELAFLFVVEGVADGEELPVRLACIKRNLLAVFLGLKLRLARLLLCSRYFRVLGRYGAPDLLELLSRYQRLGELRAGRGACHGALEIAGYGDDARSEERRVGKEC